jgi:hypothetical protein
MLLQSTVGVTRWWAGRDIAALLEPTSSHANSSKTRRLPPRVPAFFAGVRVHAVLASIVTEETVIILHLLSNRRVNFLFVVSSIRQKQQASNLD